MHNNILQGHTRFIHGGTNNTFSDNLINTRNYGIHIADQDLKTVNYDPLAIAKEVFGVISVVFGVVVLILVLAFVLGLLR